MNLHRHREITLLDLKYDPVIRFAEAPKISVPELADSDIYPFFLLYPTRCGFRNEFRQGVRELGITIVDEIDINDFHKLVQCLHPRKPGNLKSYYWYAALEHSMKHANQDSGIAFILSKQYQYKEYEFQLHYSKLLLRILIGANDLYSMQYKNNSVICDLHHNHSPEIDDISKEYKILTSFMSR